MRRIPNFFVHYNYGNMFQAGTEILAPHQNCLERIRQACAENAQFFCLYNYGIMHSSLERNYTLRTEIAWNVFIRITHDSKVVKRISMRINTYKDV